jgi:hypothetical protein
MPIPQDSIKIFSAQASSLERGHKKWENKGERL